MTTNKQKLKRDANRRFVEKKIGDGWKYFSVILPPEVIREVQTFKNVRMAEYRRRQLEARG